MNTPQELTSRRIAARVLAIAVACAMAAPLAHATDISDVPMAVKTQAKPNIMFMLDTSGSMSNIVPDAPFDAGTTYLASCPDLNVLAGGAATIDTLNDAQTFDIIIKTDGTPAIRKSGTTYSFGTAAGQKCFNPVLKYNARLNADTASSSSGTCGAGFTNCNYPGSGYLDAVYTGNYLNWYFGSAPNYTSAANFGANAQRKSGTQTRIEVARTAAKSVIDSFDLLRVRLGLFTYNNGNGGTLLDVMDDLNTTKRNNIKGKIDTLTPGGNTPLAETLADIGRYFVTPYSGNLTLHPGPSAVTRTVAQVFPTAHAYLNSSGVATPPAPIQYYCQRSFAVLMTDGRPQGDQNENSNLGSALLDYDGDCAVAGANCRTHDRKPLPASGVDQYESAGSDYLDDVALALREIDLRPDYTKPAGYTKKNNVETYTIGFADEQVINDQLMQDTATNGGGLFLTANNSSELVSAFQLAAQDILGKDGSAAA
ncbi:MAG: pilY1, partial [Acidobacteria bacterium]|nr:pilY1 [Acidobacteriota bacterium]